MEWNDILSSNDNLPERMQDIEFVKIETLIDQPITVKDFELFESESTKYSPENKLGAHIVVECPRGMYRVCTHAKGVVRGFKKIFDENIDFDKTATLKFTRVPTKAGQVAIVLAMFE